MMKYTSLFSDGRQATAATIQLLVERVPGTADAGCVMEETGLSEGLFLPEPLPLHLVDGRRWVRLPVSAPRRDGAEGSQIGHRLAQRLRAQTNCPRRRHPRSPRTDSAVPNSYTIGRNGPSEH